MNVNNIQNDDFTTKSRVESYLKSISSNDNIIEEIENVICDWSFTSDIDLEAINVDVCNVIDAIREKFFESSNDIFIYDGIHCVVHNFVWENIMPLVRAYFSEEDSEQHEKCKYLCNMRTRPEKMVHNFSSVPFTAAVVELSMLDSYKSPSEKLKCLCATYDLLFAEVKSALVTLISAYSDKDLEIPVINNEEVTPILLDVFVKSKLLHPCSNLSYMKLFGASILQQDQQKRSILRSFENVINGMHGIQISTSLESEHNQMEGELRMNDIDVCRVMELSVTEWSSYKKSTLNEEHKRRLISLVLLSTSENDFVPIPVSKIFVK